MEPTETTETLMTTRKLSQLAIAAWRPCHWGAGPALAQHGGGGGGGGFHGGGGGGRLPWWWRRGISWRRRRSFHSGGGLRAAGALGGGYMAAAVTAAQAMAAATAGVGGVRVGRYYGGAGWLGYGLFFSTLPLAYATYYWDGVPYYYADDNYYQWDSAANAYETVEPPAAVANQVAAAAPADPPR